MEPNPSTPVMIPKEHHAPSVDISEIARELKVYIDKKKLDHVDYEVREVEMYPDPLSERGLRFPRLTKFWRWFLGQPPGLIEFSKFCGQWEALFDYADKVTQDDGSGFPKEDMKLFEDTLVEIEKEVNNDKAFWEKIKGEILPIYVHSKDYQSVWKDRWASVHLFYDPIGITVTTHKKMVNQITGEVVKRELVSQRNIPAGIVVKIL